MFKIAKDHTFTSVVTIPVPADGGHENQTLKCTYKVLSDEEIGMFNMSTLDGQKDFLRACIKRLDDLVDADDNPLAFNDRVLEDVIGLMYARNPLLAGYTKGMVPARLGN